MKTQTFRAPNVMAALEEVQKELGPEAIVVSVRHVPAGPAWQVWRSPEVEIVAMAASAVEEKPVQLGDAKATRPIERKSVTPDIEPVTTGISRQDAETPLPESKGFTTARAVVPTLPKKLDAALHQLEDRQKRVASPQEVKRPSKADTAVPLATPIEAGIAREDEILQVIPPVLANLRDRLIAQGVDDSMTRKLVRTCVETLSPKTLQDPNRLKENLRQQLQAVVRTRPSSGLTGARVVCLIGPSGAGKTTICAKLAIHHSRNLGQKVAWVCADTVGAGAISEARLFTDTAGIPLYLAYTPQELAQAVSEASEADLILVDTPACNPYQEANVVELGAILTALSNRMTYLVAPATAKDADLSRLMVTFSPFNLKGIIVTRVDETDTYGNIYNLTWRSQLPLIYYSDGRRIPEDLHIAQLGQLLAAILEERWAS